MEGYQAANSYEFITSVSDYTTNHTFDMTFYHINKNGDPELRYELFKETGVNLTGITMGASVLLSTDG